MTSVLLRTQSDDRLVALAREGHERAFEAIVERYRRSLLRACRRVLPDARAEDALQHALMAAWQGLGRGDEVHDLRAWLHRIAHNTSLNQLRQSGYDYVELEASLQIADAPDDELERRAVVRQTLAGLARLPERQRDALLAIAVEGRSQDEVAHHLGLSPGAVRQLVHRARTSLRAAVTAITPLPLVAWVAAATVRGEPLAQRLAELSAGAGGAGAATALAKAGTAAVLAGGVVTGPALIERRAGGDDRVTRAAVAEAEPHQGRGEGARPATAAPAAPVAAIVTAPVAERAAPPRPPHAATGGRPGEHRAARHHRKPHQPKRRQPKRHPPKQHPPKQHPPKQHPPTRDDGARPPHHGGEKRHSHGHATVAERAKPPARESRRHAPMPPAAPAKGQQAPLPDGG